MSKDQNPPTETRPAPPPTETRPAQQPQAEEALRGSGVMQAAVTFGAIGGGVGGIAGAAHVAKHWNDPPAPQTPTPQGNAAPAASAEPSDPATEPSGSDQQPTP